MYECVSHYGQLLLKIVTVAGDSMILSGLTSEHQCWLWIFIVRSLVKRTLAVNCMRVQKRENAGTLLYESLLSFASFVVVDFALVAGVAHSQQTG